MSSLVVKVIEVQGLAFDTAFPKVTMQISLGSQFFETKAPGVPKAVTMRVNEAFKFDLTKDVDTLMIEVNEDNGSEKEPCAGLKMQVPDAAMKQQLEQATVRTVPLMGGGTIRMAVTLTAGGPPKPNATPRKWKRNSVVAKEQENEKAIDEAPKKVTAKVVDTIEGELVDKTFLWETPVMANEVQVKVKCCAVSHADYEMATDKWGVTTYPCVPGFQLIGMVETVGADVKSHKKGERVGVGWFCGENEASVFNYGGYTSTTRCEADYAIKIPRYITTEMAAPMMGVGIAAYAPLEKHAKEGMDIAVVGLGAVGHFAIKFAKALGAKVTAFSHTKGKKSDALKYWKADEFVPVDELKIPEQFDSSFDIVMFTSAAAYDEASLANSLKPEGKLCLIGNGSLQYCIPPTVKCRVETKRFPNVQFETGSVEDLCRATLSKINEVKALAEAKSESNKKDCITGYPDFPDKDCYPGNGVPNDGDERPRVKSIQITLGGDWATNSQFTKTVHQHPYWCNVVQDPTLAKNAVVPTGMESTLENPDGQIQDESVQDYTKKALSTILNYNEPNSIWNLKQDADGAPFQETLDNMSERNKTDLKHMKEISDAIQNHDKAEKEIRNPISRALRMMRDSFCEKTRDPKHPQSLVAPAYHDFWKMQLRTMIDNDADYAKFTKRTTDNTLPFRFSWNDNEKKFQPSMEYGPSGKVVDADETMKEGKYTWRKFIKRFMIEEECYSQDFVDEKARAECEGFVDRMSLTKRKSSLSNTALQPKMPRGKYKDQKEFDKARRKQKAEAEKRSPELKCMQEGDTHPPATCSGITGDDSRAAAICQPFKDKKGVTVCVSKEQFDLMMQIKKLNMKTPPELQSLVRDQPDGTNLDALKKDLDIVMAGKVQLVLTALGPKCDSVGCADACTKIKGLKFPDVNALEFDQQVRQLVLHANCQQEWKRANDPLKNSGDMNLKTLIEKVQVSQMGKP